jgi:uncharacterized protein YjbI with pentapeptide repeats
MKKETRGGYRHNAGRKPSNNARAKLQITLSKSALAKLKLLEKEWGLSKSFILDILINDFKSQTKEQKMNGNQYQLIKSSDFNQYRLDNPDEKIDLKDADLSSADLRRAYLRRAYLRGADLRGADLSSANLSSAYLRKADLRKADLSSADLSSADLRGADLSSANLSGANLRGADLRGADLSSADLRGADLRGADLSSADLSSADLRGADLSGADLSGAYLRGAKLDYQIQDGLLEKIARLVLDDNDNLNMDDWHNSCGTIHCIAGWAVTLSPNGTELEDKNNTEVAGLLLLGEEAHRHFYDSNKDALDWLSSLVK